MNVFERAPPPSHLLIGLSPRLNSPLERDGSSRRKVWIQVTINGLLCPRFSMTLNWRFSF